MDIIVYNHFDIEAYRKTCGAVFTFTFESPYILFRKEPTKMCCNFPTILILIMRRRRNSKKEENVVGQRCEWTTRFFYYSCFWSFSKMLFLRNKARTNATGTTTKAVWLWLHNFFLFFSSHVSVSLQTNLLYEDTKFEITPKHLQTSLRCMESLSKGPYLRKFLHKYCRKLQNGMSEEIWYLYLKINDITKIEQELLALSTFF